MQINHRHPSIQVGNGYSSGSTLIELLIAATVTVLVMTAVAISMMYSIQREAQNRYTETATMLAQDTLDLVQTKRAELGWDQFFSSLQGNSYCVQADGNFSALVSPCPSLTYGGLDFQREIELTSDPPGLKAVVTVTWKASTDSSAYSAQQTFYPGVY